MSQAGQRAANPLPPGEREELGAVTEELLEVARGIEIFTPSVRASRALLSQWFAVNATSLMQRSGYNRRALKRFQQRDQPLVLNVGCADEIDQSMVNADLFPNLGEIARIVRRGYRPNRDLYINLGAFDKNLVGTADGVFCSHVLEHLPVRGARQALHNCFAYLKPGGWLRVSVPCIEVLPANESSPYAGAMSMLAKTRIMYCHGHRFTYNAPLLVAMLREAGFDQVREVQFGEGPLAQSDIPTRKWESIYVVGAKSKGPVSARR